MGDPSGFDAFVAASGPSLLRTAWALTGAWPSAHDLVQTALMKAWQHWGRIERAGNLIDPARVRATQGRRHRRHVAAAALTCVLAVAALVGPIRSALAPSALTEEPATPASDTAHGWRSVTWNGLRWVVPESWGVTEVNVMANAAGPTFFTEGPSFGTIPVGSTCVTNAGGTTSCGRAEAVTTWPSDGVIAWVAAASVADPLHPMGFGPTTTADPGLFLSGVDCTGHHGTPFHGYRLLGPDTADARRVDVNGCVLGSASVTAAYTAQLDQVMSTMDLIPTTPTPAPSPELTQASWGAVQWRMPASWQVMDGRGAAHSYPLGAFVDGPYLGTVPTGPECRSMPASGGAQGFECSREIGITAWPSDGVLAWIDVASSVPGRTGGDPGPTEAVNCAAHAGTPFHAYRELAGPSQGPMSVVKFSGPIVVANVGPGGGVWRSAEQGFAVGAAE